MKKIVLFFISALSIISCSKDNKETSIPNTIPNNTPIIYNKLKAYNKNIYYENITNAEWHKIRQNFDTINNTITQDSSQYNKPNIITKYKVISSSYYKNYNNQNANYMIYLISDSPTKYIMISHATNVNAVVFKKFKKESDIEFKTVSQDGEYYVPYKN